MSQSYEKLLLSVRFVDGLIKSCLSVSFYELVKRISETEYGNVIKLKSILDNVHDSLFVLATLFVSWLISKSRTKTWIKLECMIWVPLLNSVLELALQVYSEHYKIDATRYIVFYGAIAISSSTLWIDNIAVEIINSRSYNRMSMYLYLKGSGILSNVVNVIFALTLTEHNMVYFVAPVLIVIKSLCILAFTILIKRSIKPDISVDKCGYEGAEAKPKIKHALWVTALFSWALFYTQKCEYFYTYLFITSKLNLGTTWWRVCLNLQYVSFAITLYGSGKLLERGMSAYAILLVTLSCSIIARCAQIAAWYILSFEVLIVSFVISSVCPPAGEILKSNVLASLRDSPYTLALMSVTLYCCQLLFTWVYYYVDAANVAPFVITLCLIVTVLAFSSTRLVKKLTKKFNKK